MIQQEMNTTAPHLTVTYLKQKFLIEEVQPPDGGITVEGIMPLLLRDIAKYANFTYSFVRCPDGSFGLRFLNGTWSGLIGMLTRGEANLSLVDLYMTYERSQAAEFSKVYDIVSHTILSGQKRVMGTEEEDVMTNLVNFDWRIWLGLFCCCFIFVFARMLLRSLLMKDFWPVVVQNISDQLLTMFGILTLAGPRVQILLRSENLILVLYSFTSMMTIICLSSEFSTNMVVPAHIRFPDSREDLLLAKSKTFKPSLQIGSAIQGYTQESITGVYAKIQERINKGNGVLIPGSQLQSSGTYSEVASGNIALINGEGYLKATSNSICEEYPDTVLHIARERFFGIPLGMVFSKTTDKILRKKADAAITKLFESGVLPYLKKMAEKTDVQCFIVSHGNENAENRSLQLRNFKYLFTVTFVGYTFAFVVLFAEMLSHSNLKS